MVRQWSTGVLWQEQRVSVERLREIVSEKTITLIEGYVNLKNFQQNDDERPFLVFNYCNIFDKLYTTFKIDSKIYKNMLTNETFNSLFI